MPLMGLFRNIIKRRINKKECPRLPELEKLRREYERLIKETEKEDATWQKTATDGQSTESAS